MTLDPEKKKLTKDMSVLNANLCNAVEADVCDHTIVP